MYLDVLRKLLATFTVVHAHECNHFELKQFGSYVLPEVLEVTFVRNDLVAPMQCINPPYKPGIDLPDKTRVPDHKNAFVLPDVA